MPGSDPAATGTPVAAVAGLIGANGAGKTTAVECIQGLRREDAGSIRVFGLDPARDAQHVRSQIGSQELTAFMREVELGASAVDAQGRRPEGSAHNQKGAP